MSSHEQKKFNLLHIQSDYELEDEQILLAGAFVASNDKNPLEVIEMLGIHNDLQRVRDSRRHKTSR